MVCERKIVRRRRPPVMQLVRRAQKWMKAPLLPDISPGPWR